MITPATAALQAATRTIPIVFCGGLRPGRQRIRRDLGKAGGNITGFVDIEGSLGGKWLELIHEIAPSASRGAFLFNPQTAPFARYYLETFRSSAAALNIEPIESAVHTAAEVEAAMTKLGREGGVGIIVMPETSTGDYGEAIISLADRYLLPTIYPFSVFVTAGGLMSHGVNYPDLLRATASYVDRIIEGATPDELPVQLPTKFELMINLKAAKALELSVPQSATRGRR
jgi:putative tryptophan/tyrosine transport system substrate-binding protein